MRSTANAKILVSANLPTLTINSFPNTQGRTRRRLANTTAYIQNWIAKLEEENRPIIRAAANARTGVDLILGNTFEEEAETTKTPGMPLSAASPNY